MSKGQYSCFLPTDNCYELSRETHHGIQNWTILGSIPHHYPPAYQQTKTWFVNLIHLWLISATNIQRPRANIHAFNPLINCHIHSRQVHHAIQNWTIKSCSMSYHYPPANQQATRWFVYFNTPVINFYDMFNRHLLSKGNIRALNPLINCHLLLRQTHHAIQNWTMNIRQHAPYVLTSCSIS